MADASQLTRHIETFVDPSHSVTQQVASVSTIASLIKNDKLTLEKLVREMEMYLTTTDNTIRARGILLLGEVLAHLASKPLDDSTIHSLIGFFADRLADWMALRGALVGCLALLRRKSAGGMVSGTDAKAVAQSYLQNLQVQSLGQYDRKLCFEILECLLERYANAVASLGDLLIYGICEAIDEERDPHCLMLTFHIVKVLPQLFPDPSGPLASSAHDVFEILSRYFPIHFTHPKDEGIDVKRDDLSKALMLAFSSTPVFEPFAIPLLLEKLSSSLPSAKVDSLKYLSDCVVKYGAERIAKHGGAIWSTLKDTLYTSDENVFSFGPVSLQGLGCQENEIAIEALGLLQKLIVQNHTLFFGLIVADEDINKVFKTIASYKNYNEIPTETRRKLYAVGRILYVSAKASTITCNRVFEIFLPRLIGSLGISVRDSSEQCSLSEIDMMSKGCNHGALYLCIELLQACKDLIGSSEELAASVSTKETCCCLLQSFSSSLTEVFSSISTSTNEGTHDADIYLGVKGLQILATFPGGYFPVALSVFEKILQTFVSIIITYWSKTLQWKLALKALVDIGLFIERFHETEKRESYMGIVVERALASLNDFGMPFSLKLEAVSDIGTSGQNYMLKIVQGLEEAICANLSDVYVHGKSSSADIAAQLLQCYSDKVVPWIHGTGGFEEILLRFTFNIWSQIENTMAFNVQIEQKGLLDVMMKAMKLAVASCSEESQNKIIQKGFIVLSSCTSFPLKEPFQQKAIQLIKDDDNISSRDEWILSLFASVIISVHPLAQNPNLKAILYLFMTTHLKGSVPSAQALGSLVNKLGQRSNAVQISSDYTLEEVIDIIFNSTLWSFHDNCSLGTDDELINGNKIGLIDLCHGAVSSTLQIQAINGLAWIGKGLIMQGHEKVRDITMVFLECLQSNGRTSILPSEEGISGQSHDEDSYSSVMKHAADAFQILMGDHEACLSREFHAVIRPLYKQRFFSTMMPILQSLMLKSDSSFSRPLLFRVFAHIIINTPLMVVLSDSTKLIPMILNGLSTLSNNILDKDVLYGLLLVLSGILMDKNGQETVSDSAHIIINCLVGLIGYPHMMLVRETAIQCLLALAGLPRTRIYPMRAQVLQPISKALDDPKRAVREEAVRCRQAWASIA
ncbi:hypothetical protein SLEP1_g44724 [Rubroshorea leprosula]|uniref:MMS19 nucleotide excision repair protein n=1 Tax=Rubroshorea leprosula TaxID=152421 RepID=A0AAV5LHG2_9ROSI|nr:hypothetical protein SLEP1_g44724 [Rubroshorea leprosula]